MSNHLAVATVTTALQRTLDRAVKADVNGAAATAVRPDANAAGLPTKGVNLFLYQVTPNAAVRNLDLPSRDAAGATMNRPVAAVDLHYLLTFYGDESTLEAQRVLGTVVRTLHTRPQLTRESIRDATGATAYLAASDLVDQVDLVKFTPLTLSLEDLSRLWSVFFQTAYVPSIAYVASCVTLDADAPGRASFRVRSRSPFARSIPDTMIRATDPPLVPFSATARVALLGRSLLGPMKTYRLGDRTGTLVVAASSDDRAVVRLPAGLPAGPVVASVGDEAPLGPGHAGFESNGIVFMLLPIVDSINHVVDPGPLPHPRLIVTARPSIGRAQRLELLLNDAASAASYVLAARPRAADGDDAVFGAASVPTGTYLYRLRVDGAESELVLDTTDPDPANQPYIGPTVTIP